VLLLRLWDILIAVLITLLCLNFASSNKMPSSLSATAPLFTPVPPLSTMTSGYTVSFVERKETDVVAADPRAGLWRPHQKAVSQIQWKDGVPTLNLPPVTPPALTNDSPSLEHAAPLAGAEMINVSKQMPMSKPKSLKRSWRAMTHSKKVHRRHSKVHHQKASTRTTCNRQLRSVHSDGHHESISDRGSTWLPRVD
jgi:hypothetical protein